MKANKPAVMPTKQFHLENHGSAVIQGCDTSRSRGCVVLNVLSLERPLYESSLSSLSAAV